MSTTLPVGGMSTASATGGVTTAGTSYGVADGTGPLLQHLTSASLATTPLTATALSATAKTALAAKTVAVAATVGSVALCGLFVLAAAGVGYVGYRVFSNEMAPAPEADEDTVSPL
jgi:hypothetical protein